MFICVVLSVLIYLFSFESRQVDLVTINLVYLMTGFFAAHQFMSYEDKNYLKRVGKNFLNVYSPVVSYLFLLTVISWFYLFPQDFQFFNKQMLSVLFLFLEKSYFYSITEISAIFFHLWFLLLGIKYYLSLAIIVLALRQKPKILLIILALLSVGSVFFDVKYAWSFLLGACLYVLFPKLKNIFLGKPVSGKGMKFFFILYLWTWSLVVLISLLKIEITTTVIFQSAVILGCLIAATWWSPKPRHLFLVVAFLSYVSFKASNLHWFGMNRFYLNDKIRSVVLSFDYQTKPKVSHEKRPELKSFIHGKGERKIVFIGDQQLNLLSKYFMSKSTPYELKFIYLNDCLDYSRDFLDNNAEGDCFGYHSFMNTNLLDKSVDKVVLSAFWYDFLKADKHLSPAFYETRLTNLSLIIGKLTRAGKNVFVIGNFPYGKELDPSGVVKRSLMNPIPHYNFQNFDKTVFLNKHRQEFTDLHSAVISGNGQFIDPLEFLCDEKTCPAFNEILDPLYLDSHRIRHETLVSRGMFLNRIFE